MECSVVSHVRCECCAYSYKELEFMYPISKWYSPTSMSFCVITQISELSWSPRQRMGWDRSSGKRSSCSQKWQNWFRGPLNLLFSWCQVLFLLGLQHLGCEVDNWYLELRLRIGDIMSLVPLCSFMACVVKILLLPIFMSNWHSWK